jgi:type IV pilus assembly protein PilQ
MMDLITKLTKSSAPIIIMTLAVILIGGCATQQPVNQDGDVGKPASGPKLITEIVATEDADSYLVLVKGNRQLTYTSVKLNYPPGVLFYFQGTGIDDAVETLISPDNDVIDTIEVSQVNENQDMIRLQISLTGEAPYEVSPEETGIRIVFAKAAVEPVAEDSAETVEVASEPEVAAGPVAAAADAPAASKLSGVNVTKSENQTTIALSADGTIAEFKAFTLKNPARIVFDIPNIVSPFKGQQTVQVDTEWIERVRHSGYPDKVRVVIDTRPSYLEKYTTLSVADGLLIQVGDEPLTQAQAPAPEPAPVSPPAAETAAVVSESEENPAWINRIDFRSDEAGKSTVIVGTTRPVEYDIIEVSSRLLQLQLSNTKLPKYRNRPLITTRFESAVDRITPIFKADQENVSMVAIEVREMVPYTVEQQEDVLLLHFEPSSIPPKPLEQADLPPWKQVMAQTEGQPPVTPDMPAPASDTTPEMATASAAPGETEQMPVVVAAAAAPAPESAVTEMPPAAPPAPPVSAPQPRFMSQVGSSAISPPQYTGEKIALDFYKTDIKNVFRIIREISGKNFAIDKNVTGQVTLTLEKPVPWDQVLDLVLKMNGLGMTYEGDIIRIATLATLTKEAKAQQARIAAERKSKAAVKALEPLVTEYIPVNYSNARSEILPHIKPVLTGSRGKISVDNRNNQLIVTDTAAKLEMIKDIVRRIDTVTPQVIIEAKVVEVTDEFSMEVGITWDAAYGPFSVNGDAMSLDAVMNFPSESTSSVGMQFAKVGGTPFVLNATLNALEVEQKGRIITSPKIVTLDNKKARIKQGVEWPYLERDSSGNATVKFKNIDLLLEVTPTVTPDDRISMKIFLTKNDIGVITLGVPSLNTNEAQTELLVNDGDTIVIGGIIKRTQQNSVSGWPGLKNVPLLGWLFKTESDTDSGNELLIFITPRIVQLEQRSVL